MSQSSHSGDTSWSVIRRRVSVAGYVMRAGGVPACGGSVLCSAASLAASRTSTRHGSGRAVSASISVDATATQRQAPIRSDGLYFCLDLPAGDYVLGGVDERACVIEPRTITIGPVSDRAGGSPLLGIDLLATDTPWRATHPPPKS